MSSSSTTSVKCSVAPLQPQAPQAPLQPLDSSSNNMDPLIGGPATGDLSFELTQQHQGILTGLRYPKLFTFPKKVKDM